VRGLDSRYGPATRSPSWAGSAQGKPLWRAAWFKARRRDEAYELGLVDAMGEDVCLIEWPDRLGALLPDDALKVEIAFDGDARTVVLTRWDDRNV